MNIRNGSSVARVAVLSWLWILGGISAGAYGAVEPIVVEYRFEAPVFDQVEIDGTIYDRISIAGCDNGGNIGAPSLPMHGAKLLVPYGAEVLAIEISGEAIELGTGYSLLPVAQPRILSDISSPSVPLRSDPAIYGSDAAFPAAVFEEIGVYGFRGHDILVLKLSPVQYQPQSGTLRYYPTLRVTVRLEETGRVSPLYRGLPADTAEVMAKVDNAETAQSFPLKTLRGGGGYDVLIVTSSSLATDFMTLKAHHDAHGLQTEIVTTYQLGTNNPNNIRDYIASAYLNDGISYVLIGGDDTVIPAKKMYVESWSGGYVETAMPSDLFFACLDGTWNYDGDDRWGEPTDGNNGGDVDLVADVYVGRICANSSIEVQRQVNKTLAYLNGQHNYINQVLLVGEHLGFGGISEYATETMRQQVDTCTADGYTTHGIPSSVYTVSELFDSSSYTWTKQTLANRINNGLHILNHLGHGNIEYAMKFSNSDVLSLLTNAHPIFIYSQTCLAGHFDTADCWAEYVTIKTAAGAFAAVMNARYGWGTENSTDGPSNWFNRQFWDAVYGEGKLELGRANHDSKEDNIHRVNDPCGRWCYYETNLFGDPTVKFRGISGLAFDHPQGLPVTVQPGRPTYVYVDVIPMGEGVAVPGSGRLHYSINGQAYVQTSMIEQSPNHYRATLPALACGDTLDYYFTVEEVEVGVYTDPPGAPAGVYHTYPISSIATVFADNFNTNLGWTVQNSTSLTDGAWERGIPITSCSRGNPQSDYDGSGWCYLTDNANQADCNTDVDGGYTWLISPTIDLSDGDAEISFALWYTNDYGSNPNNDVFKIYVSNNNGTNWTLVETVGPQTPGNAWFPHSFKVSDFVIPNAQVRVRFEASDLGSGSVVEAAVDAFAVKQAECIDPSDCFGDLNGDGAIDLSDLAHLLAHYGITSGASPEDGDLDLDGDVDLSDLAGLLGVYGTPCP